MPIKISWLRKPTDLDRHCLQRQIISGFSRTRVKLLVFLRQRSYSVTLWPLGVKLFLYSILFGALWVRICHTNKYVTNVLRMRTIVRICNSYICVWMPRVEIYTCANNTKSLHLIKLQRKIDTVGLCLWYRIEIVHQTPRWSGSTLFLVKVSF